MRAAVAALLGAVGRAAAAGTLRQSVIDAIELATWGLAHPGVVGAMVEMARMANAGALGGSAAVESGALEAVARPDKRGGR